MAQVVGNKSLDAEIFMDLKTGEVTFDYTLNQIASPFNSNTSAVIKDEFLDLPFKVRFWETCKKIPVATLSFFYIVITVPLITGLMCKGILKNKAWQVEHQKLLKWFYVDGRFSNNVVVNGPLENNRYKIWLPNNLWFEYHMEGDFKTMMKGMSLTRHFYTTKKFGEYTQIRQGGWDLEFVFDGIPQTGSCTVEHS